MSKLDINLVRRLPVLLARQGRSLELLTSTSLTTPPTGTPPTDITLSASSVLESAVPGTVIATISANGDSPWSFAKLNDPDGKFRIEGSNLILDQPIDFETDTEHTVRIRAANASGSHDKDFTISVLDVAEAVAPTVVNLSSTSVSESAGIGSQIATISSDGTAPVTYTIENDPDSKFTINGNTLELAATLDHASDNEHPVTIRATNAAGFQLGSFTITVTPVVSGAFQVGFAADQDQGTDGNLFVDGVNGSDELNDGLTVGNAKATVQAAIDIANPGDVIKVRNVNGTKYRETLTVVSGTAGNNIVIEGFGTEKPVITAAEPLTGAVVCSPADEPVVGPNYASIYKVVGLAKTDIASEDPRAAFLYENDTRLIPCMGRAPNPQYYHTERATKDWLDADETVTDGGNPDLIEGHRKPSFTDRFTKAQIENCDILFHRAPNGDTRTTVASFDEATDTIYIDATGMLPTNRTIETNPNQNRFILVNLLPAMRRGEWGYVDNGTTVDLYFWPIDPQNVDVNIEYSRRGSCVEAKSRSFLEFRSIILERSSSAGEKNDGHYAFNAGNSVGASPYATDITLENCWIRDTYRSESSYAPVWARHVNNFKLIQCTISDAVNQFGMQITGPFWNEYDGPVTGVWVDRNIILRSDQTPERCYGLELFMVTRNRAIDCGQAAHANKGNIYNGGHNGLWWHNYWWACPGYWTFQRSSAQFFGFNFCPGNTLDTDGRAIEDQNYESTVIISQLSPATGRTIGGSPTNGDSYFLNNILPPWRNAASYANAMLVGRGAETAIRMVVMNNIANGITLRMGMVVADGIRRNVITNGTTNDVTDVITPFGDIFEDVLLGDLAIKPDSPHLTGTSHPINVLPGHDGTRILSDVFPDYDGFGVDIAGKPIDLANPPVGCVGDPADLHRFDPVWIVRPTLTGAPVVGGSVTGDEGYIMAFGHSSRTYQWYLVDDVYDPRIDWTPIAGANSAAYSPQSGDIGKYLARRTEMDGVPIYSLMDAPVAAAFPLGNPVSLLNPRSSSDVSVGANTWFETAQITTSNKPLLVVVNSNNVTFARVAAFSATIGAAGRNGGEGTPLTVDPGTALRTRNQISFATILAPGTGAQTIHVSNDDGWSNIHVSVFEIDGMDSIVVGGEIEASNPLSLSPAITTGQINTLVFYAANRYDGTEDPLSWEGGTALLSEPTGAGGASTSLWAAMAFEQAASTGNYSQTVSWLSQQGAATSCAVEIRAA